VASIWQLLAGATPGAVDIEELVVVPDEDWAAAEETEWNGFAL
jgi:hypothetical protein